MYEQKQVIVIDGKKYAQWESSTNDHDVKTIECRPVTFECPVCGCVTADDDPFKKHFKNIPSEFVRLADGSHVCRDCVENLNGIDYENCSDGCGEWHKKNDGRGWYDEDKDWHCDECKLDVAEYSREQDEARKDAIYEGQREAAFMEG